MNQPLLRFLTTKNYKNLHLYPSVNLNNLNIFIGSNGSGKSNFISCLKFLKDCLIAIPDENRGVSSFEDAVSKIGGDRLLDVNVESPAKVSIAYCFSQINQTGNLQKDSAILDFKLYIDRQKVRASLSEEYLYGGEDLQETSSSKQPFYYYELHERELGQGFLYVNNSPGQESTQVQLLDNIPTNSLGLLTIPILLENSQFPPEDTRPVYKIRRKLIELISKWQFYNANNMNLNLIRTAEPKIGGSDIYLSASGDNLPLVLENLSQNIDFEDSLNEAMKSILPKTRPIRPVRSGRLSLTVQWYFEDIKEAFYLNEMSDGTVRMLCWATILPKKWV
ncbi:AAA family ATPase [Microcoleus sp. EPA2]|uniref:AAA family ATPase n=1 Tax=Microcoleus sp. EPA2 TaxID=2841654 RepID=UPI00312BBF9F